MWDATPWKDPAPLLQILNNEFQIFFSKEFKEKECLVEVDLSNSELIVLSYR